MQSSELEYSSFPYSAANTLGTCLQEYKFSKAVKILLSFTYIVEKRQATLTQEGNLLLCCLVEWVSFEYVQAYNNDKAVYYIMV